MDTKILPLLLCAGLGLTACTNDLTDAEPADHTQNTKTQTENKEALLTEFAQSLSRAVYADRDLRQFLKTEASRQFDKNYDVLYQKVKNEKVGSATFRDVLRRYISEEKLEAVESAVPELNILMPEIPMFDVRATNYDVSDKELPVAVAGKAQNTLYLNGEKAASLRLDEVPDFHVLVVNVNKRVVVNPHRTRGTQEADFQFRHPEYDPANDRLAKASRSVTMPEDYLGQKAIEAYRYFYKNDGSEAQKGYQRDYVYYDMKPGDKVGRFNNAVSEYISYIEVSPNLYSLIADDTEESKTPTNKDPYIRAKDVTKERGAFRNDQLLLSQMWTDGAYNFVFQVVSSTDDRPRTLIIPAKPSDLWNFHIDHTYTHKTWFRHSKHYYKIDPSKFTSKPYYLESFQASLGKWDLSKESLYRDVIISEQDNGSDIQSEREYTETRFDSRKVSGSFKYNVGLTIPADSKEKAVDPNASVNLDHSWDKQSNITTTSRHKVTVTTRQESDQLGTVRIYFYDPLIDGKDVKGYRAFTYSTGGVTFAITAK